MQENSIIEIHLLDISFEEFQEIITNIEESQKKVLVRVCLSKKDDDTSYMDVPELIICDHIDYFKMLKEKEFPMEFYYKRNIFSLEKVLSDEVFLDNIAKEILNCNFSPLEKHVAIYSLIKNFKPYKVEHESETFYASRSLYEYLNNSYFVCAGSANLYVNLAHRIGLSSICLKIIPEYDFKSNQALGHARNYVNIEDSKYNINSYFICDTTSYKELPKEIELLPSYFQHMLMTTEENNEMFFWTDDRCFRMFSYIEDIEDIEDREMFFLQEFVNLKNMISKLDPSLYPKINALDLHDRNDMGKLVEYLFLKIDRPFSYLSLVDALVEVKKHIYKNFSIEQFEEQKAYYIKNSEDLKQEKFHVTRDLIFRKVPTWIELDSKNSLYFIFKQHTFSFSILGKQEHVLLDAKKDLEELGFVYKYSKGGDLVRIDFPNQFYDLVPSEEDINFLQQKIKNVYDIVTTYLSKEDKISR